MVSFHILYVFSEEYVKESDEDLDEEDLEDNDMAMPRRYVEEMVRFSSFPPSPTSSLYWIMEHVK